MLEDRVGSFRTGVAGVCELSRGCCELKPGPPKEQ